MSELPSQLLHPGHPDRWPVGSISQHLHRALKSMAAAHSLVYIVLPRLYENSLI